jgi:hypothetical protein
MATTSPRRPSSRPGRRCATTASSLRRDSNPQPPGTGQALHLVSFEGMRTESGTRTRNDGGLSSAPLPVGLPRHWSWGQRIRTPTTAAKTQRPARLAEPSSRATGGSRTRYLCLEGRSVTTNTSIAQRVGESNPCLVAENHAALRGLVRLSRSGRNPRLAGSASPLAGVTREGVGLTRRRRGPQPGGLED